MRRAFLFPYFQAMNRRTFLERLSAMTTVTSLVELLPSALKASCENDFATCDQVRAMYAKRISGVSAMRSRETGGDYGIMPEGQGLDSDNIEPPQMPAEPVEHYYSPSF